MVYGFNNYSFIDLINIFDFVIGLINLQENLTQDDKEELLKEFSNKADYLLNEVHEHLEEQDNKIYKILSLLSEGINE